MRWIRPNGTIDVVQSGFIVGHADTAQREVRMRLTLPTSVEHAWHALTDGERTTSWLGRLDVSTMTDGGQFGLWHDDAVRSRHAVLRWHPPRLLTLTWDFPEERPSQVTFALAEHNASTATLSVHHQDLDDAVSYAAGWHRHLQYLEAHLRGGDLPIDGFWTDYDRLVELYEKQEP